MLAQHLSPADAEAGKLPAMNGSVMLVSAASEEEARELIEKDIYATSGTWDVKRATWIPVSAQLSFLLFCFCLGLLWLACALIACLLACFRGQSGEILGVSVEISARYSLC